MPDTPKSPFRQFLYNSPIWDLRQAIRNRSQKAIDQQALVHWKTSGRPVPPPDPVKRGTLAEFGAAFGIDTLIETGTFMGGTMFELKDRFKTLYSIELSPDLAARAQRRFRSTPNVHILQGDSGEVISTLMSTLTAPALFWLDGHYSAGITARGDLETPIIKELRSILNHSVKNHVILIDDARLFDGTHDYPKLDELRELFQKQRSDYQISVVNDIIRAHPKKDVKTSFT